jgi:hypothetical protein
MAAPRVAALERPPAQPLPDPNALVRSMLARDRQTSGFATAVLRKLSVEIAKVPAARASHRTGLDTLASSGSCHRTKAAAFH